MSKKLTPWFPPSIKPIHPGVYPTNLGLEDGYSFWSGSRWANQQDTPEAAAQPWYRGAMQNKSWRGLASDPSSRSTK